jgi:hypothetical protein
MLVQAALQQWLGDLLRIDEVLTDSTDATLSVRVRYTVLRTQASGSANFTQKVPT